MAVFRGSGTALVTPFDEKGAVDFEALARLIDFQIENGTDALIICGTTGEASTLTDEEQVEAVRFAAAHTNGRLPVVAGAGSNDTEHGAKLCSLCRKAGADAVLTVTPYYNKTSQAGLIKHFTALAGAAEVPLILYNVPSRTNLNILPKTARELSKVENIVGIKEANGDAGHIAAMFHEAEGRLDVYAGNDDMIVPVLSLGGAGVISTMANVIPRDTHDITEKFWAGDFKGAAAMQLRAVPLIEALFCEVNPIPVKQALRFMGMYTGGYRMPLVDISEAHAGELRQAMRDYGLLG